MTLSPCLRPSSARRCRATRAAAPPETDQPEAAKAALILAKAASFATIGRHPGFTPRPVTRQDRSALVPQPHERGGKRVVGVDPVGLARAGTVAGGLVVTLALALGRTGAALARGLVLARLAPWLAGFRAARAFVLGIALGAAIRAPRTPARTRRPGEGEIDLHLGGGFVRSPRGIAGGIGTSIYSDPVVAYLTTITAIEGLSLILRKKTPLDIILIPLLSALIAFFVASIIGGPVEITMRAIGSYIQSATNYTPFFMGIVIAVLIGMALTSPISSAAIAISISPDPSTGLVGIAGGAAVIGGVTQMLGFAVMSRKDNNIGTVISVAIGTSMLQFKNILKKPVIWLPPIIVSAILGPVSTLVFRMESTAIGSGMGTSSFVGQIGTLDAMGHSVGVYTAILILHFVLPLLGVFALDLLFRKRGYIKPGDLKI